MKKELQSAEEGVELPLISKSIGGLKNIQKQKETGNKVSMVVFAVKESNMVEKC